MEVPPDAHPLDVALEDSRDAEEHSRTSQYNSRPPGSTAIV